MPLWKVLKWWTVTFFFKCWFIQNKAVVLTTKHGQKKPHVVVAIHESIIYNFSHSLQVGGYWTCRDIDYASYWEMCSLFFTAFEEDIYIYGHMWKLKKTWTAKMVDGMLLCNSMYRCIVYIILLLYNVIPVLPSFSPKCSFLLKNRNERQISGLGRTVYIRFVTLF